MWKYKKMKDKEKMDNECDNDNKGIDNEVNK